MKKMMEVKKPLSLDRGDWGQVFGYFFRKAPGVVPVYFLKERVMVRVLLYPTNSAISFRDASVWAISNLAASIRM